MADQSEAAAVAQREIARLQRTIQGYRTQAGSRGVQQRAQIPALEARIAQYQREIETGQYGGDVQARMQQIEANRGRPAKAPANSLSAASTNRGVQASRLPGSIQDRVTQGEFNVRTLRPGQETEVRNVRLPYRPQYAGEQRTRLQGTIQPDNPYAALVGSRVNIGGFEGSRAFGRRLSAGLKEEYERQQTQRARGGVVESRLPGSVQEAQVDLFGFSAGERFARRYQQQVVREQTQREALRQVDARFPFLAPALTIERVIRTAPETALGLQSRLVDQAVSIGRGYQKIARSVDPFNNQLTTLGANLSRRALGTSTEPLYTPNTPFFKGPPISIKDKDIQQATLFTLTTNPFTGPATRVFTGLTLDIAEPVRRVADVPFEFIERGVGRDARDFFYSRSAFTSGFVEASNEPKNKQTGKESGDNPFQLPKDNRIHAERNAVGRYLSFAGDVGFAGLGLASLVIGSAAGAARLAIQYPILGYGFYRVASFGSSLFGKTFNYGVAVGLTGYSVYEAPEGKRSQVLIEQGTANLFFAGVFGDLRRGVARASGSYRPDVVTVGGFPRMPRQVTFGRLRGLEGESLPVITGKGAGREFYVGEPKYAGTKGSEGFFGNPVSTEAGGLRVFRYGEFAVNPYRNPTYYRNQLRNLVLGRERLPVRQWTLRSPELTISNYRVRVGRTSGSLKEFYAGKLAEAEVVGRPVVTVAPKTLRRYGQPEEEVFALASRRVIGRQMRVRIGTDAFGTPVTRQVPRAFREVDVPVGRVSAARRASGERFTTRVEVPDVFADLKTSFRIKAGARLESYRAQFRERDLFAKDVAERGLVKYRLIQKDSPLANVIDNSGKFHVESIKKIGRGLERQYGVKVDKKLLDAFADVHDINKEPVRNFSVARAIDRALQSGYLDEVKTVKGLAPDQRRAVGRMVILDEKPPLNIGNLFKRPIETIKYSPYRLTKQEKLIINADRLARFGSKADPDMLFYLGSEVGKAPKSVSKAKERVPDVSEDFGSVDEYYRVGQKKRRVLPLYLETEGYGREPLLEMYDARRPAMSLRMYAGAGRSVAKAAAPYSLPERQVRYQTAPVRQGRYVGAPRGASYAVPGVPDFYGGGGGGYPGGGFDDYFGTPPPATYPGRSRLPRLPTFDDFLLVPDLDLSERKKKRKMGPPVDEPEYAPSLFAVVAGIVSKRKPFEAGITPFGIRPLVRK